MIDILNDSEFKEILNQVNQDPKILALVIFGSYARGESFRDIDICLFGKKEQITPKIELNYRTRFSERFDVHFFHKLPLYIRNNVMKDGKIIIDKDYEELFEIYYRTIKEYNLFKPHFDLFLEAYL